MDKTPYAIKRLGEPVYAWEVYTDMETLPKIEGVSYSNRVGTQHILIFDKRYYWNEVEDEIERVLQEALQDE